MKNIVILLAILVFSSQTLSATNNFVGGSISGRVIDSKSNEPLPYVNIIVKSISGEIITGSITDDEGVFDISNINDTTFIVSVQYIGYKTIDKKVQMNQDTNKLDLGTLVLEEDNTALDEVTVIAETSSIQQKVDRKVITIGKDLAASGTASELMVGTKCSVWLRKASIYAWGSPPRRAIRAWDGKANRCRASATGGRKR